MSRRCRSCLTVNKPRKRKCEACGRKLPPKTRQKHMAALEQPYEAFVEANDGYDGCWICRELGIDQTGKKLHRDHAHTKDGGPRGVLCIYHNMLLGPRYTPALMAAYAKYLNRKKAA